MHFRQGPKIPSTGFWDEYSTQSVGSMTNVVFFTQRDILQKFLRRSCVNFFPDSAAPLMADVMVRNPTDLRGFIHGFVSFVCHLVNAQHESAWAV